MNITVATLIIRNAHEAVVTLVMGSVEVCVCVEAGVWSQPVSFVLERLTVVEMFSH